MAKYLIPRNTKAVLTCRSKSLAGPTNTSSTGRTPDDLEEYLLSLSWSSSSSYSSSLSSWWTLRSALTTSLCAPCPSSPPSCECDPTEPLTFFNFWHPRSLSSASHMYSQHLTKNHHINQMLWILNFLRVLSQNVGQTLAWFCLAKGEKNMYQVWKIPVTTLTNP